MRRRPIVSVCVWVCVYAIVTRRGELQRIWNAARRVTLLEFFEGGGKMIWRKIRCCFIPPSLSGYKPILLLIQVRSDANKGNLASPRNMLQ
jgi:hypothetical protein